MTTITMTRPVPTADAPSPEASAGIPFRRLLRVEWDKATDTRAARWLLGLVAASTIGLMLGSMVAPSGVDQTYSGYLRVAALGVTILLPVVSILTLTSEWSQRTVLTTFTQEPRRNRVITAKIAVSLLLAAGGAVFGGLVTAASLGLAVASGRHLESNLTAGVVIGYLLFILVNVLMGVALGALLHNSAAAIVCSFALPAGFALLGQALKSVGHWVDTSYTFDWLLRSEWSGHTPQILSSLAMWVAVPLAAGLIRTVRRDIH